MRTLIAILLLIASGMAGAANPHGYVITVLPNPVPAGSAIGVTIETTELQCKPLPETMEPSQPVDGVVHLWIPSSDGCEMVPLETRSYTLAAMAPGDYIFNFYSCAGLDADTGQEACSTIEDVPVTVLGVAAQRTRIPTLSTMVLLALGSLVACFGAGAGVKR